MLAKLKLLKTSAGPDTILMISGILIIWFAQDGMLSQPYAAVPADPVTALMALLLAAAVILVTLWDALRPLRLSAARRIALRVLACSALIVPLCTKLVFFFNDIQTGDAFPWWLMAAGLFWLPLHRRMAHLVFAVVLLSGLALTSASLTPALWSAWIAAYLVYLLYKVIKPDDALA